MAKTAKELYEERLKRLRDTIQLNVPDKVPTFVPFGYLPMKYAGLTREVAFYDLDKFVAATRKTVLDFQPDLFIPYFFTSGVALEILGPERLRWPGHGVPADSPHQILEMEFMKADEYDLLIEDPIDFIVRTVLPRSCKALAPFKKLPSLINLARFTEGISPIAEMFADPDIVAAGKALYEIGQEQRKGRVAMAALTKELEGLGFPQINFLPGLSGTPYDFISDYLRGIRGTMLDMYQRPEKLLEAIDKLFSILNQPLKSGPVGENKIIFMAHHMGGDGFLSPKQFDKFWWPGYKASVLAAIEVGATPLIYWEGNVTSRLEHFLEFPEKKIIHLFDRTDVNKAKEVLGGHSCVAGGMVTSILETGTVQEVKDYCKRLIDTAGKDGGFIMGSGHALDSARPENVKAMIEVAREYGVYK